MATHEELIVQFVDTTSSTPEFARSFLEMADWNLQDSLELFWGGGGGGNGNGGLAAPPSQPNKNDRIEAFMRTHPHLDRETAELLVADGHDQNTSPAAMMSNEDDVRAPIEQKRVRLFDTPPTLPGGLTYGGGYGMMMGMRADGTMPGAGEGGDDDAMDLLDDQDGAGGGDEDMAAQARIAHMARIFAQGARGGLPLGVSSASSLQPPMTGGMYSLAAPPRSLLFLGSFEAAREAGKTSKRWLLVNLQDQNEFQSFVLNRDLWSNEMVQQLIQVSFVFWQREFSSEEGRRFENLYHPHLPYPVVCILDPRTGELLHTLKLKGSEDELRHSFQEQVLEFLDLNAFGGAPPVVPVRGGGMPSTNRAMGQQQLTSSSSSSYHTPPMQTPEQEDEELAAAIAASLSAEEKPPPVVNGSAKFTPSPPTQAKTPQPVVARVAIPDEPPISAPDTITIAVRFPDAAKPIRRRFYKHDMIEVLFVFVASQLAPGASFDIVTVTPPPRSLSQSRSRPLADENLDKAMVQVKLQ